MDSPIFHNQDVSSQRILYTPSAFARSNLFYLQETGNLKAQRSHISKREHLASYLLFVVLKGSGTLHYDGVSYDLQAGDLVFIDCRKPYAHSCNKDDLWQLEWVHFYGPNMSSIYDKYLERGGLPKFISKSLEQYVDILDELYTIANSSSYVRDMQINAKLSELLVLLMEDSWHGKQGSKDGNKQLNIQQLKDYLDTHYTEKISLDDLATSFHVSKFYMLRLFKERYGATINDYILHCRINYAKQLLRFTDMPIAEIGYEVGLGGANYIARMFKKVEGVSPSDYREMW